MTTSAMPRPSLQDFIKTAMVSSAAKVDLSLEGARQLANSGDTAPAPEAEKTASARSEVTELPTEYVEKLAGALEYVAASISPKLAEGDVTTNAGPGKGPQSLETNQGKLPTEDNIDANQTGQATQGPPMSPATKKLPGQVGDPGSTMETNVDMSHAEQPVEPISNEKTTVSNEGVKAAEAAYLQNLVELGLLKVAAAEDGSAQLVPANDMVKEALLSEAGQYAGSGIGGAALGGAGGAVKGGLMGGLGGAALGGAGGALAGLATGGVPGMLAGGLGGAALGGTAGGLGGAALGGAHGAVKGGVQGVQRARAGGQALAAQQAAQQLPMPKAASAEKTAFMGTRAAARRAASLTKTIKPKKAPEVDPFAQLQQRLGQQVAQKRQATEALGKTVHAEADPILLARNYMQLGLYKEAEDALNPASVSAGANPAQGATPPVGAAPAEQGVPAEPSDVSSQKQKMLSSNQAAINYTKRDAKADPKSDLGDVLKEPAQTKSTDKVLANTLDNEGGNKISSITRQASARAILSKLAEEMGDKKPKTKTSMPPMPTTAPTTPQGAAGPAASQSAAM